MNRKMHIINSSRLYNRNGRNKCFLESYSEERVMEIARYIIDNKQKV